MDALVKYEEKGCGVTKVVQREDGGEARAAGCSSGNKLWCQVDLVWETVQKVSE